MKDSPTLTSLFQNLLFFSRAQLASFDVDPLYPVLRYLHRGMDHEQALWHSILYVGYYNLASATAAFLTTPLPKHLSERVARYPTGVERRGFRGGAITQHISSLLEWRKVYGGLDAFLREGFGPRPRSNWLILQENLQRVWGNGRWAAYKTGEILQKVHDFPVEPTDMGHAFSSGPRHGLALFYGEVSGNTTETISRLDRQGDALLADLRDQGVVMGIEQLETMLCDFHALVQGRYYVGHDIDQFQAQLLASPLPQTSLEPLWDARRNVLPHAYLGELNGWQGVDHARKRIYKQTGRIVTRE